MTEIASLAIQIDSTQAKTATVALTGLANAAKPASAAVQALAQASAPASAAAAAMGKATTAAAGAHAGFSTQAMSAAHAVRSMVEGLALGMSPLQVATQQMAHLSYAASGPGGLSGAFKEAGAAFAGFLTPARLAGAAIAAAAVAAGIGIAKLAESQKSLGDLSERTGDSLQRLNALQSAAGDKGIGSTEFNKNMTTFANLSAEAQHQIGALYELFQANNTQVGTFDQNLTRAASIIARLPNDAERYRAIQALGLTDTRNWVQFLGQGGAALNAAANSAQQLNNAADERFVARVREMSDAWNTFTTNISTAGKSVFLTLADALDYVNAKFGAFSRNITTQARSVTGFAGIGFPNNKPATFDERFSAATGSLKPLEQAAPKPSVNAADLQKQNQLEMPRLGLLGETPAVTELENEQPDEAEREDSDHDRDNRRYAA